MRNTRILGVVPARLGSERLPRKPLHSIAGRPLVEWVWRRVAGFDMLDRVVVATDAEEVLEACAGFGAEAVLTAASHGSGTERIAEVVGRGEYGGYDVVVNVQGDEPFVRASQVNGAVEQVLNGFDIGTVAAPVRTRDAWLDPSVVKVTRRTDGAALYFSRSPIPYRRDGEPTEAELGREPYLRHVGIYAYRPRVLAKWVSLPPSRLEEVERLEQLRALEAGLTIGVGLTREAEGGVDTPADARRAEQRIVAGEHSRGSGNDE